MKTLKRITILMLMMAVAIPLMNSQAPTATAQEGSDDEAFVIVTCAEEQGCEYTEPIDGLNKSNMELVLAAEDETGNSVLLCTAEGCEWSAVTVNDLDILYGGDGDIQEVTILEDEEVEDIDDPTEDVDINTPELGEGFIFEQADEPEKSFIPREGSWESFHEAGQMVCSGGVSFDIPAGDVQQGVLTVLNEGETLTAESFDPEVAELDMNRRFESIYGAELTLEVEDGATMTMYWEQVFVSDALSVGIIHGNIEQQGLECTIYRSFHTIHLEGLEIDGEPGVNNTTDDELSSEEDDAE